VQAARHDGLGGAPPPADRDPAQLRIHAAQQQRGLDLRLAHHGGEGEGCAHAGGHGQVAALLRLKRRPHARLHSLPLGGGGYMGAGGAGARAAARHGARDAAALLLSGRAAASGATGEQGTGPLRRVSHLSPETCPTDWAPDELEGRRVRSESGRSQIAEAAAHGQPSPHYTPRSPLASNAAFTSCDGLRRRRAHLRRAFRQSQPGGSQMRAASQQQAL